MVWGGVVNGLQLGISPPAGTNGVAAAVCDGSTLQVRVHWRNTGNSQHGPLDARTFLEDGRTSGSLCSNKVMVIGSDGQVKWEYPAPNEDSREQALW